MAESVEMIAASKLGTKEHWENVYQRENQNFQENGDEGEVWFGEDAMNRMVKFLDKMVEENLIQNNDPVVDLGTGNGVMLRELDEFGFTNIFGLDYAEGSVELARSVCENLNSVTVDQADLLNLDEKWTDRFVVALDKGTLDAISLNPEGQVQAIEKYSKNVATMLCKNKTSYLLITSCNWTLEELKIHLSENFEWLRTVPVPTFSFGGKTGSTTTTVLFKRK